MLFNPAALFEALTLQAARAANVGDKSLTYTPMSDAIKAVKLPSDQQELLFEFLQHAKEDIPGWVPAAITMEWTNTRRIFTIVLVGS